MAIAVAVKGFMFSLCFSNSLLNTSNKVYGDCEPVSLFNNCKLFREPTYFMGQRSLTEIERRCRHRRQLGLLGV